MKSKLGMTDWMALAACGNKEEKAAAETTATPAATGIRHVASDELVDQSVAATKQFIDLVKAGQDDKAIAVANQAYDYYPNPNDRSAEKFRADSAKGTIQHMRDIYDMATFQVIDKGAKDHFGAARVYYKVQKKAGGQEDNDYISWKPNSHGQPYMVF